MLNSILYLLERGRKKLSRMGLGGIRSFIFSLRVSAQWRLQTRIFYELIFVLYYGCRGVQGCMGTFFELWDISQGRLSFGAEVFGHV